MGNGCALRIGAVLPAQEDAAKTVAPVLDLGPGGFAVVRIGSEAPPAEWWLDVARRCAERQVAFAFSHTQGRLHEFGADVYWTEQLVAGVRQAGGEFWLGDVLEHPTATFTFHRSKLGGEYPEPPFLNSMTEAHEALMTELVARADVDIGLGIEPVLAVDGSLLQGMICEAGVDIPLAYIDAGGPDPALAMAAARGASAAFGSGEWGVVIGPGVEPKAVALAAFVAGASYVLAAAPEGLAELKQAFEGWQCAHERPPEGPFVRVGVLFGHAAGYAGTASTVLWNQWQNLEFEYSDAERDWELLPRLIYEEQPWRGAGSEVPLPLGQVDIVPLSAPREALEPYSCLIMLGWNTMTEENYEKLVDYVRGGGHLLAAAPQLSVAQARSQWMEFLRAGDVAELFGCRLHLERDVAQRGARFVAQPACPLYRAPVDEAVIVPTGAIEPVDISLTTGRVLAVAETIVSGGGGAPLLVENRCGEGFAYLLTAANYFGSWGMERFALEVLRMILAGQRGRVRLRAPHTVRFAVYDEGEESEDCLGTAYLLNAADIPAQCVLEVDGVALALTLGPGELRSASWQAGCLASPSATSARVRAISKSGRGYAVRLEGVGECRVDAADAAGPLPSAQVRLRREGVEVNISR